MSRLRQAIPATAVLIVCGCSHVQPFSAFEPADFVSEQHHIVLAFDLRDDAVPKAAICLTTAGPGTPTARLVALPFAVRSPNLEARANATIGQYSDYTLVGYTIPLNDPRTYGVSFQPVFATPPQPQLAASAPQGVVYLLADGLSRTFIYRYDAAEAALARVPQILSGSLDTIQAIAVALPIKAVGREVSRGRTTVPDYIAETRVARLFPPRSPDAKIPQLEIRYDVPPSLNQERFAGLAAKVLAALTPPLLGLLFLPRKGTKRPRLRVVAIALLLLAQAGVLLFLVVIPYLTGRTVSASVVDDLIVLVLGTIATVTVLVTKQKPESD